ncbi:nuclear transport factor 2 family protein [Marinicaulis aureus]|uniref:Nuclear transport factor 2 family protein n=1 Tax=Hyphococcus aureus TaxID=2666033 RepID=A0ABW1KXH6_9PROT
MLELLAGLALVLTTAADDEAVVRKMIETKYAKENACDATYAENYVADDATEYLPNYLRAMPKEPQSEIMDFEEFCAAGGKSLNEPDIQMIERIADDVILVTGIGSIEVTRPDGTLDYDGEYSFTNIFVKTGDGWRVRHLHVAPIIPELPTVPARD